ncbi:unnamed protein product [Orchesella dallaii]|uniref:Protein sleepless n=1 Tax=Orchesella dallaii TaxID=48710 RepID=A0ABP1Q367_9HEXA
MFSSSFLLLWIVLVAGCTNVAGIRCFHCQDDYFGSDDVPPKVDQIVNNTQKHPIAYQPSCGSGNTPDPRFSVDCSQYADLVMASHPLLQRDAGIDDLLKEKIRMGIMKVYNTTTYSCVATFLEASVEINGTLRMVTRAHYRSCFPKLNFIDDHGITMNYTNLFRKKNMSFTSSNLNVTGYLCDEKDLCNFDNYHHSLQSQGTSNGCGGEGIFVIFATFFVTLVFQPI